jgi:hypothetical protein
MLDIQKVVKNMRAELVSHSMLARRGVWAKQFLFFSFVFRKKPGRPNLKGHPRFHRATVLDLKRARNMRVRKRRFIMMIKKEYKNALQRRDSKEHVSLI